MPRQRRKYSRPTGHVEKIYPLAVSETDEDGKSHLTDTKTIGFVLDSGEAAKLAVALMNSVSMMSKDYSAVDLTVRIHDGAFSVTVS